MRIELSDIENPRVNLLRIAAKAFLDGIGFWFTGGPSPRVRACPTWQIARDALGQAPSIVLHNGYSEVARLFKEYRRFLRWWAGGGFLARFIFDIQE